MRVTPDRLDVAEAALEALLTEARHHFGMEQMELLQIIKLVLTLEMVVGPHLAVPMVERVLETLIHLKVGTPW